MKWVADRLALPYDWIEIDTLKGGSRTAEFLKLNPWGQVPAVDLDDGRTLAQSNAIIRYLARGSELIPADAFAAAKMDEWLFWEQYSHEPYVAVCRFQMVYLGKNAVRARSREGQARLSPRSTIWSGISAKTVSWSATTFSLADVALVAYTRVAHEGGFDLARYASIRRWIGETEKNLGLTPTSGRSNRSEHDARILASPFVPPAATTSPPSSPCSPTIISAARASGSRIRCRRSITTPSNG